MHYKSSEQLLDGRALTGSFIVFPVSRNVVVIALVLCKKRVLCK
jgi:hypothetical protein